MSTEDIKVEVKDLPQKTKVRLFAKRDLVNVTPSEEFYALHDAEKVSAEIEPMTHEEAEVREKLLTAIDRARLAEYRRLDISQADVLAYQIASSKLRSGEKDTSNMTEKQLAKYTDERMKEVEQFNEKWKPLSDKLVQELDTTATEKAEDNLREFSVSMLLKRCKTITVDGEKYDMSANVLQSCNPALIRWLVSEIEDISYLNRSEKLGL